MAIGHEASPYEIPRSRGAPPVVRVLFLAGIVVIFMVGAVTVYFAHEFHVWPAHKVVHAPLSGSFNSNP